MDHITKSHSDIRGIRKQKNRVSRALFYSVFAKQEEKLVQLFVIQTGQEIMDQFEESK